MSHRKRCGGREEESAKRMINGSMDMTITSYPLFITLLAFLRGSAALRPSRTLVSSVETRESSKQHMTYNCIVTN